MDQLEKMEPLLEGRNISKYFGGLAALDQVNISVYPGEILGLIGPNGSGKTTLVDCLSRVQVISSGQVFFKGLEITQKKPYQVAHLGLARTFQTIRVYRKLTVLDNMLLSRQWHSLGLLDLFRTSPPQVDGYARELLDFLSIGHLEQELAGNLSWGQLRLLELGMALMPDPDLILLDEGTSGVNPSLLEIIKERIRFLKQERGKSFLLVEHNMQFIEDLCSRIYVLDQGKILAEGTPDQIINDEAVIAAYFGAQVGELS
jgi:ABC-type branched-subunit amino acid transport system ATPase component